MKLDEISDDIKLSLYEDLNLRSASMELEEENLGQMLGVIVLSNGIWKCPQRQMQ
jgi:hypothetical protein